MSKKIESDNPEEPKRKLKVPKSVWITIIVILVIVIALLIWLYTGSMSNAKQKIFSTIPLPVALVELSPVSSTQYFDRYELAEKVVKETGQDPKNLQDQILTQLIETEKIEVLARKHNLHASREEIDAAYKAVVAQFPNASEEDLEKALQERYGLDLNTFKNEAVRQVVIQDKLSRWFNEQESLNTEAYQTARDILKQLDNGASFEEVANKYNQDPASKDFSGDSGFVPYSALLPEFQEGIKDLAIGDKKLVASRYGLHIIKVLAIEEREIDGKKEKTYNLQQIYTKPNDFLKWFAEESVKIRSYKLI